MLLHLGQDYLDRPKDLVQILGPVIAQQASEQEKFHAIWNSWWEEVMPKTEAPPSPVLAQLRRLRYWWVLPLILLGAVGGVLLYQRYTLPPPVPKPSPTFSAPRCVQQGLPVTFTQQTPELLADSSLRFLWRMGDGTVDSVAIEPVHIYDQPGYREVSLQVWNQLGEDSLLSRRLYVSTTGKPVAGYSVSPPTLAVGTPVRLLADSLHPQWTYTWDLGDGAEAEGPEVTHIYDSLPEKLVVSLLVRPIYDSLGFCEVSQSEVLKTQEEIIPLPEIQPLSAGPVYQYTWSAWAYISWILLTFVLMLGIRGYEKYRQQPLVSPQLEQALSPGKHPPYRVPFPSQDTWVAGGLDFYALADALRRRERGNVPELHIQETVSATIRQAGFPDLRYRLRSRPTNYLVLIEKDQVYNQQALLFEALIAQLQAEEVPLEVFSFKGDPRICYHPQYPEGIPLSRLYQLYPMHKLMIFGKGASLLSQFDAQLRTWVPVAFEGWDQKALLTPQPVRDWGYRERLLSQHFLVLPADMQGQLALAEAFNLPPTQSLDKAGEAVDPADFLALKRRLRTARKDEKSLTGLDALDMDSIRAYLGTQLFSWLAATALYPRPTWELTLAIGKALESQQQGGDFSLNFDALLRLTRIPWLQEGELPDALRADLIATLDPETEQIARRAIRDMLLAAAEETPPNAFARQEREIQLILQEARLNPQDPEAQKQLGLLADQGLLDPVSAAQVAGEQKKKAQRRSFMDIWRWRILPLLFLLSGIAFFSFTDAYEYDAEIAELRLVAAMGWMQVETDSMAWYNQAGVAALAQNEEQLAQEYFLQALKWGEENGEEQMALPFLNVALTCYREGKAAYDQRDWALSQERFGNRHSYTLSDNDTTDHFISISLPQLDIPLLEQLSERARLTHDSIEQHSQHALGLAYFYDDQLDSARKYLERLLSAGFFKDKPQSLLTLIGTEEQKRQIFLDNWARLDSLVRRGSRDQQIAAWQDLRVLLDQQDTGVDSLSQVLEKIAQTLKAETLADIESTVAPFLDTTRLQNGETLSSLLATTGMTESELLSLNALSGSSVPASTRIQQTPVIQPGMSLRIFSDRAKDPDTVNVMINRLIPLEKQLERWDPALKARWERIALDMRAFALRQETPTATALLLPEMIRVQGGTFQMGAAESDGLASGIEKPQHLVTLRTFSIAATEVTCAAYAQFLNALPNPADSLEIFIDLDGSKISFQGENYVVAPGYEQHPVTEVSWYGARAYCHWLNEVGAGGQRGWALPTEAQWEYAARGGNRSQGYTYAGSKELDEVGWYDGNSDGGTHPVGQKQPNELGIYDLSGNVWEWCADWFGDYAGQALSDPQGPGSGVYRVIRGGGWHGLPRLCRVSYRFIWRPGFRYDDVGFRLAFSPQF